MIHVDQQIAGRHRELSNIGVFYGDCADLFRRRSEPGNVASGDRGQVGRYLDAHDLVKRLLRRDQQHTPLATTEVDERIFREGLTPIRSSIQEVTRNGDGR